MAKPLKARKSNGSDDGGTATAGHNVGNRKKMIGDALKRTLALDVQIAAAIKDHVQDLRDAKSEIKADLRKDLQITAEVFNARYAAYKLEGKAIANDDRATIDNIRELFEHSPVGSQVHMFGDEHDGQDPDAEPGYTAETGRQACRDGKALTDNPHKKGSKPYEAWESGFLEAKTAQDGEAQAADETAASEGPPA